jgi:hypothetical protein
VVIKSPALHRYTLSLTNAASGPRTRMHFIDNNKLGLVCKHHGCEHRCVGKESSIIGIDVFARLTEGFLGCETRLSDQCIEGDTNWSTGLRWSNNAPTFRIDCKCFCTEAWDCTRHTLERFTLEIHFREQPYILGPRTPERDSRDTP